MGWIDVLTDMVKGLRATGKSEKEIEAIVEPGSRQSNSQQGETGFRAGNRMEKGKRLFERYATRRRNG